MLPQEISALRKETKKLMIDLDLDIRKHGTLSLIAGDLSAKTGRKISRSTLSMALTGYRSTRGYQAILQEFSAMLQERTKMQA